MLEKYKEKQSLFYNFVINSVSNNKISHAYLIETNGVDYALDLAVDLAKYFLCDGNDCDRCKQIDLGNYPDLVIVDNDTDIIKKEQMLDLQREFLTKPLYGKYRIYIIKNATLLNKSSANTILKFLEEPSDNIIAFLLVDNVYNVIDTIVSRCKIISLVNNEVDILSVIAQKYMNEEDDIDSFKNGSIELIVDLYMQLENNGTKVMLNNDLYSFKDKIKMLLEVGMYIYNDVLNAYLNRNLENFKKYEDKIIEIMKLNSINDIIRKIDIINQFLEDANYNVNKELFLDNFIISMGGNIDD